MTTTSLSLLERIRQKGADRHWRELTSLYQPHIRRWLYQRHAVTDDCDDVTQDVLLVVARRLGEFEHNGRRGAFRNWLKTITVNCLRDFRRSNRLRPASGGDAAFFDQLSQLEDPQSQLSRQWDHEHDLHIVHGLLRRIQSRFSDTTWNAFEQLVLQQESAQQVADQLNISINAVYIAKSRVLTSLRAEARGLLDDELAQD